MSAVPAGAAKRLVPHLPATCIQCFERCSPTERAIARLMLKVILEPSLNGDLSGTQFYFPTRVPLCQQAQQTEDATR